MSPETISAIADAVTALVAVSAGSFAVREYWRAGKWKAAELAAAHLQQLATDDRLAFACHALDWGIGPIPVPALYRTMAGKDTIEHTVELLKTSLQPNLDPEVLKQREGLVYRHCFDRLFGHLDTAQELLDLGLVEKNHLRGLRYWLAQLADWRYAAGSGEKIFIPFLISFGYGRVLRLFESLNVPYDAGALEKEAKALIAKESVPG